MPYDASHRADPSAEQLHDVLRQVRAAYARQPAPTARERIDRLDRLHNAVLDYKDRLVAAVDADFGSRPAAETLLMELLPVLQGIAHNRKHVRRWMKPSRRETPLMLAPSTSKVHCQPLGVIGIVVPWNFPLLLSLSPLVSAFAAGNRAMIKTSEYAPQTGAVLQEMLSSTFSDEEVVVFTGGVEVATEFTKLPFDHLVFTGSTQVGRIVMRAAAENLTPVTLELGGKSPAIVHPSFPIQEAASRIALGKGLNAGQVCVAPDYLLLPRDQVDAFATAYEAAARKHYPTLASNGDYTSIITERQHDRLQGLLADAAGKGAELISINPADESLEGTCKVPMTLLKNVSDEMQVMQEEIFGPVLPLVPYDDFDEAIAYVNARPRPLALYYFDWDKARGEHVLAHTHSGGVALNDVLSQGVVDDMPFGGVGPSGMGHYHGKEGFLSFSKAKPVIRKGRLDTIAFIAAPWGNRFYKAFMAFQFARFRKKR
ncbi:MAG: coniferyl aldehyde dehydrogenase [Pseudomonadota bacterium]